VRARVFVIEQLFHMSLLSLLSRRAPRTARQSEYRTAGQTNLRCCRYLPAPLVPSSLFMARASSAHEGESAAILRTPLCFD
jgi:hypothetical protein